MYGDYFYLTVFCLVGNQDEQPGDGKSAGAALQYGSFGQQ